MHQQKLENVIAGLEVAWAFFGGMTQYLVIDNFPAAVVGSFADSPAGQSRPASCSPCPGAGRTSGGFQKAHPIHHRPANLYTSTVYIPDTIQRVVAYPLDDGGRYSIQPPNVSNLSAHAAQFTSADYS